VLGTRRLLARLRERMAAGVGHELEAGGTLDEIVGLVAAELVAEVCSVYAMRPGDLLELAATHGLRRDSVGRTRLRVGEGIVGSAAATAAVQNLPDAQNHPAFAYRPETGEDAFASMLAVPVRRGGRTLGVLTVQNKQPRRYAEDEVEVLETVAMVVAELLAASGATDGAGEGLGATLPRHFAATPIAPGIAVGPVIVHGALAAPSKLLAEDPAAELTRLATAVSAMQHSLDQLIRTRLPENEDTREIMEATRLFAIKGSWARRMSEAVGDGLTAEAAVHRVMGELRDRMRRVADPYLRERLADLEDLAARLLDALADGGESRVPQPVPPGALLLARRLGPAQLLDWHARGIAGAVIEEGSPAGHAAIIARALNLPLLGGARGAIEALEPENQAVLDADEGVLILRPDPGVLQAYQRAIEARAERAASFIAVRGRAEQTVDGVAFSLMLNVGLAQEMAQLDLVGADGIGLFRTEIAMLARGEIGDVAEQAAIYARVLDLAGDRPVRFRTLDLGGDKLLPGAPPPTEENPAMGWRSLRVGLDRPVLMRRQLRALLLASGGRELSVMFPMVSTVSEFRTARGLLFAEAARVRPAPSRLLVGSMIEVPALLWQLPALLREADFVSIGTNDLMQFLFAADRGAPALAGRYDLLSPAALDVLESVQREAALAGREVSVCGEHAGRPLEAMVFAALGITTLSMPAASLLRIKALLLGADLSALRAVLAALRRTDGPQSLREPLLSWAREHGHEV